MSENSNPTQNMRVLDYMDKHGGITQIEALRDCGVMRLASRISDLKKAGLSDHQPDARGAEPLGRNVLCKAVQHGGTER